MFRHLCRSEIGWEGPKQRGIVAGNSARPFGQRGPMCFCFHVLLESTNGRAMVLNDYVGVLSLCDKPSAQNVCLV